MYLDVRYVNGDPRKITVSGAGWESKFIFTIEGRTARLVDVRKRQAVEKGASALSLSKLSCAHDAILKLPFIDEVTVWMKGRTRTLLEDGTEPADVDGDDDG